MKEGRIIEFILNSMQANWAASRKSSISRTVIRQNFEVTLSGTCDCNAARRGARSGGLLRKRMLALSCRGSGSTKWILQKLCHGLQDFARKLLVRHCAGHTDGTDKSAIGQDCLRPCRAVILLVRATNHSRSRLHTVLNFPSDHSASSPVAACNISCQSDDWTACAWLIAVRLAQVIIDERLVRNGRPARRGGIHLTLPRS